MEPTEINASPRELTSSSTVVLITEPFEVSLINQLWLVSNGVIREDEITGGSAFGAEVATIQNAAFHLLFSRDRTQITIPNPQTTDDVAALITRIVEHFVDAASVITKAVGINFGAFVLPSGDFAEWNRRSFANSGMEQMPFVAGADALFGSYFSFDRLGYRVRATIMPTKIPAIQAPPNVQLPFAQGDEAMVMAINFHQDLSDPSEVRDAVSKWAEAWHIARQVISHFV